MTDLALDYAKPQKTSGTIWVYLLDVAAMFLIWIIAGILLLFVFPNQREMLRDFKVTLPAVLEWMVSFADWFANGWGWAVMFGGVFAAPLPRMVWRAVREKHGVRDAVRGTVVWFVVWVAVMGLMEGFFMGMVWMLMNRGAGGGV